MLEEFVAARAAAAGRKRDAPVAPTCYLCVEPNRIPDSFTMPRRLIFAVILSVILACLGAFKSLEAQQAPALPPSTTENEKWMVIHPPLPAAPEATPDGKARHQPDAAEVQRHRSQKLSESEQTELIRELQVLLKGHNCYGGEVNGLREDTRAAVAELRRQQSETQAIDLAEMTIGDAVDLLDWLERQPRPICQPVSGGKEGPRHKLEQAREQAERARTEQLRLEAEAEQARRVEEKLRQEEAMLSREVRRLQEVERARQDAEQRARDEQRRLQEADRLRLDGAEAERLARPRERVAPPSRAAERGEGGVSFDRSYARSGGAGSGGAGASGGGVSVRVPSF